MCAHTWFDKVWSSILQRQPSRGVPSKICSENMQQIYRRTPMPKCDFNKAEVWFQYLSEHLLLGTPLGGCFWYWLLSTPDFQKPLEFVTKFWSSDPNSISNIPFPFYIWADYNFLLLRTTNKRPDMTWSWNLHWEYCQ